MDGWPALSIHIDKSQAERDWVLSEFKAGKSPIMTATDVAARGLELSTLVLAEHESGSINSQSVTAAEAAKSLYEDNSVSLLLAGSGPSLREAVAHAASCHPSISQVLGGKARQKKLLSPRGMDVRPMMEVVKGAAFGILQAAGGCPASLRSGRWLDLYSGTGSVGIEAISRGCSELEK
ncbi:hypothetical protein F0562_025794 [Nyssa sinensis]|uniref:Helicase C-terminal domain-containing protein n=1 Tax=Nyssa sinensis TaxID=561372 RepID=A0A5J5BB38_9ASTE|nr:hypothetical protein F0562_025794 [Nyssa sinensis]